MRLTLLTPTENWARTAKGYNQPSRDGLQFDYNLGKYFHFQEIRFGSLNELCAILQATKNAIAISGVPNDLAETLGTPPRQTKYFPYPDNQHTHVFDIDKWKVPTATRELVKPDLTNPESMGELINTMLRNEGFDLLAEADKLVVLTSSSWDTVLLNCHIRVIFDKPLRVEALRQYSIALAKVHQRKLFDDAVYKSVQPQFFTPPTCIGFKDPYQGKRIFFVKGSTRRVSLDAFKEHVNTVLKMADWDPNADRNELPPIGRDWLITIEEYVGEDRGINEPAHRAAAQLVQSVGKQHVLSNINEFAQQMFDLVWKTLAIKGERGDTKDKQTYTIEKFRQYLSSACDKTFGDDVDQMVQQVQEAIQRGVDGNLEPLMSTPVLRSLTRLKAKHTPRFLPLKKAIIEKHSLLKAQEFNALIKYVPQDTEGEVIMGSDGWNENQLIDTVLQQYDYLCDSHGNRYASVPGNGDGGYRMLRIDGSLVDTFYSDGLKLSGNQVGGAFGKKSLSKLVGDESRAVTSTFEQQLVGTRVVTEDQTVSSPTWINLGLQPDGQYKAVKLEADKVTLMDHQSSKPRWFWGVPSLIIPNNDDLNKRFGTYQSMMDYLTDTLPNYICAEDDELVKAIMWLCSTMSDKSLSYLLEITGPAGSGKSTGADLMKDLVDPSGKMLGSGADRTAFWGVTSDFISDIERRHVTILDNISKLSAKEQDMLCMVSTGLRHSERILYTQSQMERVVRRPIIMTALSTVITRPDLRSRVVTIETNKVPNNLRFLEQWQEDRPYLVACLFRLTAKTLKLYRDVKDRPEDMNPRDLFLACIYGAIHGINEPDFEYVREFRLREAWEAAYDSAFVNVFIRFIEEAAEGKPQITITTRNLHQRLRDWCQLNAGKKIDGFTVDVMAVPETGRGMGWEISKNIGIIEKVSPWKHTKTVRLSNGKRLTFTKTLDTMDDLL